MLTDIEIKNFRGFRSLKMNNLGRITLVGGRNGVGKTALLEALWMLSAPDLPELSERMNEMRGLPSQGRDSVFQDMFFGYDTDSRIKIAARGDWKGNSARALEVFLQERKRIDAIRASGSSQPNPSAIERLNRPQFESETEVVFKYNHDDGKEYVSRAWWVADQFRSAGLTGTASAGDGIVGERQAVRNRANSIFIPAVHRENLHSIAAKFSDAQLQGDVEKILAIAKLPEPRLKGLTLITIKDVPVIHAYLEGMRRPIPVQLLGEGLNRMLGLALSMEQASGGMMLIDEIENGLHYRVQREVFCILLELAKAFDVQIFATTHSRECIVAAHQALNKEGHREFAFYRLDRRDKEIKAVSYDVEMLDTIIEHRMDPR